MNRKLIQNHPERNVYFAERFCRQMGWMLCKIMELSNDYLVASDKSLYKYRKVMPDCHR